MDLTKLSDADLLALKAGDYAKMSDDGLKQLKASSGSSKEPSGVAAGFAHGAEEMGRGIQQTAKVYGGIGTGPDAPSDPDYVPAEVINGWNPLKWNYGQLPQKIAEVAPSLAETAASSMAGAKVGGMAGIRGRILGGLAGAAAPYVLNNAGNDAKANAVRRTGDANAEPETTDKVRAGVTDTAAGLVQGIGPMRFIPGGAVTKAVGTAGLKEAAKKYITTVGDNALGGAAGDLAQQIGNTIGTDKGTQVDLGHTADAAIGNAGAAAIMGAPRALANTHTAISQRGFGGENADATSAYFNRLAQNAGAEGLGKNSKADFDAHENTVANLKKELKAVDPSGMDQDTANTLSLASGDKPLTLDHVKQIEKADPQAGFLARQLYVAQQAEGFGSYDRASGRWAGGLSGMADKHVVQTLKRHAAVSGLAGLAGVTLHGSYALPTLGGAAGVYLGSRALDNLTGMRSPAKGLAEKFVDQNVPTRLAPPPEPAAPPPQDLTQGPWGPKPQSPQSVPQVAPPAAPTQPWQKPQVNELWNGPSPIQLSMLKQKLKAGLPEEAPPAPAPEPVTPGTAEWKAPQVTELPQFNNMALKMLGQKLKEGLPPGPQWKAPTVKELPQAPAPAPVNPLRLPTDVTAPAKNLMKGLALAQSLRQPAKITKAAGGPVQVKDPSPQAAPTAEAAAPTQFYRPLGPEEMTFGGKAPEMTPAQIGRMLAEKRMADKPEDVKQRYANSVADTHTERRAIVQDVIARHPDDVLPLMELLAQLHERGTAEHGKAAVQHYAKQVSPAAAADLLSGFNDEAVKRIWPTKAEKRAKRKAKKNETTPDAGA
ncbi:hypothetical protein [Bradyrhizobium lupini]|uniref:hypothetical protein n=1 Tax=Rhizobium lupini TaxID=136996 RepID=UPI0034C5D6A5